MLELVRLINRDETGGLGEYVRTYINTLEYKGRTGQTYKTYRVYK